MAKRLLLVVFLLAVLVPAASSAPLYFNTWTPFLWNDAGAGTWTDPGLATNPFTLDLTGTDHFAEIRVTDRGYTGDSFDVYANGLLVLQTPDVTQLTRATIPSWLDPQDPANVCDISTLECQSRWSASVGWDGQTEWGLPALSQGSFTLAPGAVYELTIQLRTLSMRPAYDPPGEGAYTFGGGFIEAIQLPEPATFGMLGVALIALSFLARKRRR